MTKTSRAIEILKKVSSHDELHDPERCSCLLFIAQALEDYAKEEREACYQLARTETYFITSHVLTSQEINFAWKVCLRICKAIRAREDKV